MRNIIVVDVMLAGTNFIHDIICRGYKPIVLLSKVPKDSKQAVILKKIIEKDINSIKYDFEIIHEQDSYEKTRELVKKYDPLLIIPGSELGMLLATKLSNDFGLVGNSIENLGAMTLKDEMQKRLAQNNLRHIRGRVVNSLDEAIEFYDEECLDEVVVKPIYSTESTGVRICLNKTK